jgi:predicted TIM-barrel fold metal-dependent hydrolase
MWGTDWPMLRYERTLQEIEGLDLRRETIEAYMSGNALKLLTRIL